MKMIDVEVVVDEECREKAISARSSRPFKFRSGCCLVWQGLKFAGINIRNVALDYFTVGKDLNWNVFQLPMDGRALTRLDDREWPTVALPVTFTVSVPESALTDAARTGGKVGIK